MMGSRVKLTADECDAFSRQARRILVWRSGETHAIKRRFWKVERLAMRRDAAERMKEAAE